MQAIISLFPTINALMVSLLAIGSQATTKAFNADYFPSLHAYFFIFNVIIVTFHISYLLHEIALNHLCISNY